AFLNGSSPATFDGSGNYTGGSIVQYAQFQRFFVSISLSGSAGPFIDHSTFAVVNRGDGIAGNSGSLRLTNSTFTPSSPTSTSVPLAIFGASGAQIQVVGNTFSSSFNVALSADNLVVSNNTFALAKLQIQSANLTFSSNTVQMPTSFSNFSLFNGYP